MAIARLAAKKLIGKGEGAQKPLIAAIVRRGAAPSDALLKELEGISAETRGRVDVVAVDLDEDKAVMDELRVTAEPEIILWADGRIVERSEGEMTAEQVDALVAHTLQTLAS